MRKGKPVAGKATPKVWELPLGRTSDDHGNVITRFSETACHIEAPFGSLWFLQGKSYYYTKPGKDPQ